MRKNGLVELMKLKDDLWNYRRSTRDTVWQEIFKYTEPQYQDFEDRDGTSSKINPHIYNATPANCVRMASMGMAGYACSPSIDWFSYSPEIGEFRRRNSDWGKEMRAMLQQCTKIDRQGFAKSNWYSSFETAMHLFFEIGTVCVMQEWDDASMNVVYTVLHPSDFVVMESRHHVIDTVIWRERMTIDELDQAYPNHGDLFSDGDDDRQKFYWVYHYCGRRTRLRLGVGGESQPYECVAWFGYEGDGTALGKSDPVLEEKGSDMFPFVVGRYMMDPTGNPYGVGSPGMVSLIDNKTLQAITKDELDCATLQSHPPIKATEGLPLNIGPFSVTRLAQGADFSFVPSGADMTVIAAERSLYEQKIQESYHVNFFLALMNSIERTKTATEAEGLQNEQSAMLSSLFDKIDEMLERVIEFRYHYMVAYGMYGDGYTEGEMPKIDFTSPMRQLQERTHRWVPVTTKISYFAQLAQMLGDPTILKDYIRLSAVSPLFDEIYNTPSEVGYTERETQQIQAIRAQAQMQMAQAQMHAQQTEADARMMQARNQAPESGSPNDNGMLGRQA